MANRRRRSRHAIDVNGRRFDTAELLTTLTPAEAEIIEQRTRLSRSALPFADPDDPDLLAALAEIAARRAVPDLNPADTLRVDAPGHGFRGASFNPGGGEAA